MDVFLDPASRLTVSSVPNIDGSTYEQLEKMAVEFAFDTFIEMKGDDVMSHGGISIDECVVPFIKIKAVENNG